MPMILIKGAGDLATGIALRLHRCGYRITMTETPVPTTVRRTVAFSRAVYEGYAEVEGIRAILCRSSQEAGSVMEAGNIAVVVDEKAEIIDSLRPDIVVDAILAKKNLGTDIYQAPFVVGVGPGFTAGKDCDCVIETKRGHYLGRVLWEGSAIPNTGVPGEIGGYSIERIIRAIKPGIFRPIRFIGDRVKKGDVVAESGGAEITALMPGIIRGMLQEGVEVFEGMKCGDIDARCDYEYCFTASDKALSVGGGVLEAITMWERGTVPLEK